MALDARPPERSTVEIAHRKLLDGLRTFADFDTAELDAFAGVLREKRVATGATVFNRATSPTAAI